jgi:hypothetical protein
VDRYWLENLRSKLFLIFLLAAFVPHLAEADDKTIPGSSHSQGATAIPPQPASPLAHQHFYYSVSTPVVVKAWDTYTNVKWGFSVQYPLALGFDPPPLHSQPYGGSEIVLPTIYDAGVIRVSTYSDQSINTGENVLKNVDGGDAEPFPYSLKNLREDLTLPIGSECKANKNSEIVDFNGVKALRMEMKQGDFGTIYFILRGKYRWVEIDVRSYGQTDNLKSSDEDLTINLRSLKKAAAVSVLRKFKFFKLGDAKTDE